MPLRDIRPFRAWIEREEPSMAEQRVARTFIAELTIEPWKAPSVPLAELSGQPDFEVRSVVLLVPGGHSIRIWYRHTYATGDVDILTMTNR